MKDIKDEEIYINNRDSIKEFISFYNSLNDKEVKNEKLKLSDESKLADFFVSDDNEFGKSYKRIYNKFIQEQNKEIADLLDIKIDKGIFESNCKNEINIQSANSNEIFIINLPDKFSFVEVAFHCSSRKNPFDTYFNSYNQIEVDLNLIEETMTELLLKNKKLFNNSIIDFIYSNENLEFENKNIISEFYRLYEIKNIDVGEQKVLYQFYETNKTKNDDFFKNILNEFIKLIIFLNSNKKLLNEDNTNAMIIKDDSRICEVLEKFNKISDNDFINLFKEKDSLIISKTTNILLYYRELIFRRIKQALKPFQYALIEEQKSLIKNSFEEKGIIKENIFKLALRSFIVFFINLEKDKNKNIKENNSNIINYLDIPDLWDPTIYNQENFKKELNDLKEMNVKVNQTIYLYDFLGDDIDEKYFENVIKILKKEEEIKKIEEKKEPPLIQENQNNENNNDEKDDSSFDFGKENEEEEDYDNDENKYI